jgi:hypothetical protein
MIPQAVPRDRLGCQAYRLQRCSTMEKPILCRLNGAAAGLGATIALLCDIIVADEKALIGDPHVKVGLVAGDGGALIWPQLIGYARAKELLMTGEHADCQRRRQGFGADQPCGARPTSSMPNWARWHCQAAGQPQMGGALDQERSTNMPLEARLPAQMMDAAIGWESDLQRHLGDRRRGGRGDGIEKRRTQADRGMRILVRKNIVIPAKAVPRPALTDEPG